MQAFVTPLLKESILLLGAKRAMLRKEAQGIETIVVGSSHGDFGFDPRYLPKSFNLCCRSQDLKHSYHLYKQTAHDHPEARNVVLFYSLFSPGSFLERSPTENDICPALNEIFNLGLRYEDSRLDTLCAALRGKLADLSVSIDGVRGFLPQAGKVFFPESYGARNRATEHLRYNRTTEANAYVVELLKLASSLKHRVCIVVPPVRSDYRKAAGGDSQSLFGPLFQILHSFSGACTIDLMYFFDNSTFQDSDFGDYDHLLPLGRGTQRLSQLIAKAVRQRMDPKADSPANP